MGGEDLLITSDQVGRCDDHPYETRAEYEYEEEIQLSSDSDEEDTHTEDLDATLQSVQKLSYLFGKDKIAGKTHEEQKETIHRAEVIDDFVRNFLVKTGLTKTLNTFETEWFELRESGKLNEIKFDNVPDEYTRSMHLEAAVSRLTQQLQQVNYLAQCRQEMLEKIRKERNIHRMHHRRIAQEKNKLIVDVKRLQKHFSQYEPIIKELKRKYEVAVRQKALIALERDKLLEQGGAPSLSEKSESSILFCSGEKPDGFQKDSRLAKLGQKDSANSSKDKYTRVDPLSIKFSCNNGNSYRNPPQEPTAPVGSFTLQRTFRGHSKPISNVAIHPRKPVVATASDDATWKMWGLPDGDLIMTGDGHKEWVAGLDFHPRGMQLASSSGDCTVKVWSFEKARCIQTFLDHTQAVWSVSYHDSGDVLASASLDHTARIWDLEGLKCRGTLRGHVDSVNSVTWKAYSSILCTASSDKTVSLWDARTSLCVQTFYGHQASCSYAVFNPKGTLVASVDSRGIVKVWDTRKVAEFLTVNTGPNAANKCAFDKSGNVIAVASSDNAIKCFDVNECAVPIIELVGHEDVVQAVVFDPLCQFLVSGSTDCTFRVWG